MAQTTSHFSPDSLNRKLVKLGIAVKHGKADIGNLHKVTIKRESADEAQEWCQKRFEDEWIWSSPTQVSWSNFYFRTSEDALAFALTFAGSIAT